MIKSVGQLKDALKKERRMYQELLQLARHKTTIITEGKIKELEDITKQEQQYLMDMGTFEKIRRSVFANASQELNISKPSCVSELLLFLEEEDVQAIDDLRNSLLEVIDELKNQNALNEKLLHQSLEYIHFNLELLSYMPGEGNHYSNSANEERQYKKFNLFDMRV